MATGYETIIGLEVHAQLLTASKIFCGCSTAFGAAPNTHVCPVCLGLPGALPVPNGGVVQLAMRAALALGCSVCERSVFERKNYFYPDLAKGYQISQYALPLNANGRLLLELKEGQREVSIVRIHLEEDAAKNLHGVGSGKHTLVDFNRAGVPLIEIVTGPDMRSSAEAEQYLRRLREILMYCGVNDGNLEEGSFRCDANVSIRPTGQQELGTRVELKNINSFRFVRKAIDYEVARQAALLSAGGDVVQETRSWNEGQAKSLPMRSKEEAMDYRYFPDPDLPPLRVGPERVAQARQGVPELPESMRERFSRELGLITQDASVLTAHPEVARFFERSTRGLAQSAKVDLAKAGKRTANFIQAELLGKVQSGGLQASIPVTAEGLAELLSLVESGALSGKMAKEVIAEMIDSGDSATAIVERRGLTQVSDTGLIQAIAAEVLDANPQNVQLYLGGKTGLLGFFVGQVMKKTKGTANPKLVNEVLRSLLSERS